MKRTEYRVVWQREGLSKRTARFRSLNLALRKATVLQGRIWEVTDEDPDGYQCCSGYECGCRGIRRREYWKQISERVPSLVFGPVIQKRKFEASEWRDGTHNES